MPRESRGNYRKRKTGAGFELFIKYGITVGEVSERFKELVLKTSDSQEP